MVTGNSASNYGGGVTNDTGTLQLSNSTLSGNSAARGGGIWNGDGGTLSVSNSTLSGNTASVIGGGIWNTNLKPGGSSGAASMLTLINSTLSGNSGGSGGGGIYNGASTLTATFSTISGNSAASGGGILNDTGTLVVQDTIVANSPTGGNCFGFNGTVITSQGYNLSDDTSCSGFFNQQGDFNNTPAGLDPAGLQNNGGPTKTIALLAGSSALNAIPGPCAVNTDQRGVVRLLACDIGAFEVIPDNDSGLAGLNGGNTFTGNQVVNGTVSATNFVGSISPTNISRGTAAIDISGTAANATNAVNATNAASAVNAANLGGIAAGNYARLDIGNNLNGNQNVTGNLTTTGSVGIGGGTPIIEHLSATFDPSFPPLKSLVCASLTFALAGTSPGDTVALGVSDSRMTGGGIIYSAWVSTPGNITLQGCSITGNQGKTAGSGAIRVDVWKH